MASEEERELVGRILRRLARHGIIVTGRWNLDEYRAMQEKDKNEPMPEV